MRKIIIVLLSCMLIFTGCGDKNTPSSGDKDNKNPLVDFSDEQGINDESYVGDTLDVLWPGQLLPTAPEDGELTSDTTPTPSSQESVNTPVQSGSDNTNDTVSRIRTSLAEQKSKYKDTYGWLYVSGTKVDYAVAQSTNNSKYLRKNWDLKYANDGTIFVDYENGPIPSNERNMVLYGHNMNTKTQFGSLQNLRQEETFKNSLIYLFVGDTAYVYQPFAEFATKIDFKYNIVNFKTPEDFAAMTKIMKDKSLIKASSVITENDKIITLSTCTNNSDDERYVVAGKLITTIDLTK